MSGLDITGIGSLADLASSLVNRFWPASASEAEKIGASVQIQQMLASRETAVLDAQKAIITAEMNQTDTYTKRARPTIVYFGLVAIGMVHVLLPMAAWLVLSITGKPLSNMPTIALPGEFWMTWGGVCGVWIIGRSAEKSGAAGKVVDLITGGKTGK